MRSLRSRLILASILWTGGLLLLMHMLVLLVIHVFPHIRGAHSVLAVLAALLFMTAGVLVVRRSLTPFAVLREKLRRVRSGHERSVEGVYPSEVQPLVDELNALLAEREAAVQLAFATAGDLAHGLKTPLALLAHEANRTGAAGNQEAAESIAQHVERMSRHINYHLARARAAASGPAGATPCAIGPCADALVRTLLKLYADRELDISSVIGAENGLSVKIQREDFEELLGNLLDNACKWATARVVLTATQSADRVVITVDDDGIGLAPELRTLVLARGVRMDETTAGSGLGLAITRDLVELYRGSISLEDSPLGGLRARVSLPAIPASI